MALPAPHGHNRPRSVPDHLVSLTGPAGFQQKNARALLNQFPARSKPSARFRALSLEHCGCLQRCRTHRQFASVVWTMSGKMSEKWMKIGTTLVFDGRVRQRLSLRRKTKRSEALTLKNLSGWALIAGFLAPFGAPALRIRAGAAILGFVAV